MEIENSEKVIFITDFFETRRYIIKAIGMGSNWVSQILPSLEFLMQKKKDLIYWTQYKYNINFFNTYSAIRYLWAMYMVVR